MHTRVTRIQDNGVDVDTIKIPIKRVNFLNRIQDCKFDITTGIQEMRNLSFKELFSYLGSAYGVFFFQDFVHIVKVDDNDEITNTNVLPLMMDYNYKFKESGVYIVDHEGSVKFVDMILLSIYTNGLFWKDIVNNKCMTLRTLYKRIDELSNNGLKGACELYIMDGNNLTYKLPVKL